jgi:ATP-dependent Zn protease
MVGGATLSGPERRFLAYHEAGHAVVADALGWRVGRVMIADGVTPRRRYAEAMGVCQMAAPAGLSARRKGAANLAITWAGVLAEEREMRCEQPGRMREVVDLIRDKCAMAEKPGPLFSRYSLAYAERRASRILGQRWQAVEAVAAALLERERLEVDEAVAIIRLSTKRKRVL